jgi:hypothetical protein
MLKKAISFLFLLLILSSVSSFWYANPDIIYVKKDADINGQDLNVGIIYADIIDTNAILANYWVARNFIDSNFLYDVNFFDNIQVAGNVFGNVKSDGDSNFTNIGVSNNLYGRGLIIGDKFKSEDANSVFGAGATALGSATTAFGNYSVSSPTATL